MFKRFRRKKPHPVLGSTVYFSTNDLIEGVLVKSALEVFLIKLETQKQQALDNKRVKDVLDKKDEIEKVKSLIFTIEKNLSLSDITFLNRFRSKGPLSDETFNGVLDTIQPLRHERIYDDGRYKAEGRIMTIGEIGPKA